MQAHRPVAILDDGELKDVRALLRELDVSYVDLWGETIGDQLNLPSGLFLTTPRYASRVELPRNGHRTARNAPPACIGFIDDYTRTAHAMLRRSGCDQIVRLPIHPYALRLLLLRALYDGREHRSLMRFPIGAGVQAREGLKRSDVTLADLSENGCQLLCTEPIIPDRKISVRLARSLTSLPGLWVTGSVIRCSPCHISGNGRGFTIAIRFDRLDREEVNSVKAVLAKLSEGPLPVANITTAGSTPSSSQGKDSFTQRATASLKRLLRRKTARDPRCIYPRPVIALGDKGAVVVSGRNLSERGIAIHPCPKLKLGNRLKLALYGKDQKTPLVVHASVIRDDGPKGLVLGFEEASPLLAEALQRLVTTQSIMA